MAVVGSMSEENGWDAPNFHSLASTKEHAVHCFNKEFEALDIKHYFSPCDELLNEHDKELINNAIWDPSLYDERICW